MDIKIKLEKKSYENNKKEIFSEKQIIVLDVLEYEWEKKLDKILPFYYNNIEDKKYCLIIDLKTNCTLSNNTRIINFIKKISKMNKNLSTSSFVNKLVLTNVTNYKFNIIKKSLEKFYVNTLSCKIIFKLCQNISFEIKNKKTKFEQNLYKLSFNIPEKINVLKEFSFGENPISDVSKVIFFNEQFINFENLKFKWISYGETWPPLGITNKNQIQKINSEITEEAITEETIVVKIEYLEYLDQLKSVCKNKNVKCIIFDRTITISSSQLIKIFKKFLKEDKIKFIDVKNIHYGEDWGSMLLRYKLKWMKKEDFCKNFIVYDRHDINKKFKPPPTERSHRIYWTLEDYLIEVKNNVLFDKIYQIITE